ncbi:ShKT domain-containing protein [Caenorhabditis elegans]|uniref:ShKT domain-containing protein n=1 Tax=Caenorhabditis elegans TaxID=6239 RepID=Q9GZE4_CAEEL|nr:ShKT domain-containing protein [Caenorhabditis elegans]CCD66747.1 ShKT domain-containing protein [Caenorhabditis elegans]|eukprot:NP_500486.1 Uncharacterized protein CELE_F49F1.5 [Caenorhabditis elegans]
MLQQCLIVLFFLGACSSQCMDTSLSCPDQVIACFEPSVQSECPYSCATCQFDPNECVDRNTQCQTLKVFCDDPKNSEQCQESCGICVPTRKITSTLRPVHVGTQTTTVKPTSPKTSSTASEPCYENPICPHWAANGFCTNPFYSPEHRKKYCGKTCNLC